MSTIPSSGEVFDFTDAPASPNPLAEAIADEAHRSFRDSGYDEAPSDEAVEKAVKQGDPNWHRRSPMEKHVARMQMRQQLQYQAEQRQRAKALADWRAKPNADRISFAEVKQVGEETGHRFGLARFNLMIRGALRQQGYQLGLN
jgi:hypothetical protein